MTALTRIDVQQNTLIQAVVSRVQLPAAAATFLHQAVIVIAREGGGAGADGVAAMLTYMAQSASIPVTLVDFSFEGEEGAAWSPHSCRELTCKRLVVSTQMGADIGDLISHNLNGIIIINTPPGALYDIAGAEPEFLPIIRALERPYFVFWIDRPNDQKMDRLEGFRLSGGNADWIVGVLAKATDRFGDAQQVNVWMPDGSAPVKIPLLPSQIANFFYNERLALPTAVERATVGQKSAFYARLRAFASELRDAL